MSLSDWIVLYALQDWTILFNVNIHSTTIKHMIEFLYAVDLITIPCFTNELASSCRIIKYTSAVNLFEQKEN